MSVALMEDTKPFVEFYIEAVKDGPASHKEGRVVYKDAEFVRIIPMGDAKLVIEKEVDEHDKRRFSDEYEAWKKGEEAPVHGTHLKKWPLATPADIKNCALINVRSVEQLAGLNDDGLRALGMGSRTLQAKAKEWLKSAHSTGKVAEEIHGLKVRSDEMEEIIKEQLELIKEMKIELDGSGSKKRGKKK